MDLYCKSKSLDFGGRQKHTNKFFVHKVKLVTETTVFFDHSHSMSNNTLYSVQFKRISETCTRDGPWQMTMDNVTWPVGISLMTHFWWLLEKWKMTFPFNFLCPEDSMVKVSTLHHIYKIRNREEAVLLIIFSQ